MSRIPLLCLTLSLGSTARALSGPHPNWANSLKPKGGPGAELMLARHGKTDYTILTPAEPSSQEQKAAEELSHWLKEMTGASFPIISEGPAADKVVSVGRTQCLRDARIAEAERDLGDEGYGIAVRGTTLFLFGGGKRGPLYAVFALLEEDLGCRWYTRGTATIPRLADLTFRPVPRTSVPAFEIRDPFYWDAFDRNWSLRNRTNSERARVPEEWGGRVDYARGWFVHTFDRLVAPKEHFGPHPEYFSVNKGKRMHHVPMHWPGQLCLTDPQVLRISIDKVKAALDKNPHAELISVSENDGRLGYCQCARCEAVNVAEGSPAGTLVLFVNAIAAAVAPDFPHVKIATLAYGKTFMPPKNIRPRSNVVIRLCTDTHAWRNPFLFVTETEQFQTALKAWHRLGAKISIWDYTTSFGAYLRPWPNMPIVTDNIRVYRERGVSGIMLQGCYQSPGGHRAPMRCWVWAKQLWDPSRDTRELMRDFTYGYYGTAAEPMQRYNDLLWRTWQQHHDGAEKGQGYPIDRQFVEKALTLFRDAERLTRDDEVLRRVQLAKLSVLYARLDLGIEEGDDGDAYLTMVNELKSIAEANRVTHLRERPRGIDQHLLRWRSIAGRALVQLEVSGTIFADDIEFRLATHLREHAPKVVEDRRAGNGYAVRQPGGSAAWSIQWVIPIDDLRPGVKYRVRVRMRVDKKSENGKAFHAGVYNVPNRSYPIGTKQFMAAQVPGDRYQWFDLGKIVPQKGDYVYVAPDKNLPDVIAVYTDRIELVPVGAGAR